MDIAIASKSPTPPPAPSPAPPTELPVAKGFFVSRSGGDNVDAIRSLRINDDPVPAPTPEPEPGPEVTTPEPAAAEPEVTAPEPEPAAAAATAVKPSTPEPEPDLLSTIASISKSTDEPVPSPSAPAGPKPRDYSGLPPELATALRKVGNREFDTVAPLAKKLFAEYSELQTKHKEAETKYSGINEKLQSYYNHPEAYRLSPEFQTIEHEINYRNLETRHWKETLAKLRNGQPGRNIQYRINKQSGQRDYFYTDEIKPSAEAEVEIETVLHQTTSELTQLQSARAGFGEQFQQNYHKFVNDLRAFESRIFPGINDSDPKIKADIDTLTAMVPPPYRKNVFLPLAAKAMHIAIKAVKALQEAKKSSGSSAATPAAQDPDARASGTITTSGAPGPAPKDIYADADFNAFVRLGQR